MTFRKKDVIHRNSKCYRYLFVLVYNTFKRLNIDSRGRPGVRPAQLRPGPRLNLRPSPRLRPIASSSAPAEENPASEAPAETSAPESPATESEGEVTFPSKTMKKKKKKPKD